MNTAEFKKRWLMSYIEPSLFYIPFRSQKPLALITIHDVITFTNPTPNGATELSIDQKISSWKQVGNDYQPVNSLREMPVLVLRDGTFYCSNFYYDTNGDMQIFRGGTVGNIRYRSLSTKSFYVEKGYTYTFIECSSFNIAAPNFTAQTLYIDTDTTVTFTHTAQGYWLGAETEVYTKNPFPTDPDTTTSGVGYGYNATDLTDFSPTLYYHNLNTQAVFRTVKTHSGGYELTHDQESDTYNRNNFTTNHGVSYFDEPANFRVRQCYDRGYVSGWYAYQYAAYNTSISKENNLWYANATVTIYTGFRLQLTPTQLEQYVPTAVPYTTGVFLYDILTRQMTRTTLYGCGANTSEDAYYQTADGWGTKRHTYKSDEGFTEYADAQATAEEHLRAYFADVNNIINDCPAWGLDYDDIYDRYYAYFAARESGTYNWDDYKSYTTQYGQTITLPTPAWGHMSYHSLTGTNANYFIFYPREDIRLTPLADIDPTRLEFTRPNYQTGEDEHYQKYTIVETDSAPLENGEADIDDYLTRQFSTPDTLDWALQTRRQERMLDRLVYGLNVEYNPIISTYATNLTESSFFENIVWERG